LIENAKTDEGKKYACTLIGEFINVYHKAYTFESKKSFLNGLYAIFANHAVPLPSGSKTPFGVTVTYSEEEIIKGSEEEVVTIDELKTIIQQANPMEKAVFLSMFQSEEEWSKT